MCAIATLENDYPNIITQIESHIHIGEPLINPLNPPNLGEVCIGGHPQTPEVTTYSSGSLGNL